jgi:SAM-dependent methyltransferase
METIAARWDAKARHWEQDLEDPSCHLNEDQAYDQFLQHLALVIEQRRDFCAAQGVVDAGCGTGLVLAKALSSFAWGVGIDISPEMIRMAQAKQLATATFVVGDCFQLSSACPKAGAVLSRGVLLSHYGPQQGKALLGSARAALIQGGFILLDFLNQSGRAKFPHAPENKSYFEPAEVCEMAIASGFRRTQILGEDQRRVRLLLAECA